MRFLDWIKRNAIYLSPKVTKSQLHDALECVVEEQVTNFCHPTHDPSNYYLNAMKELIDKLEIPEQ